MKTMQIFRTRDFNHSSPDAFRQSVEVAMYATINAGHFFTIKLDRRDFRRDVDLEACDLSELRYCHVIGRLAHILLLELPGNRLRVLKDFPGLLG